MSSDKQHALQLLDQLDQSQLSAVVHLLEVIVDPVARSIADAPLDDEPVTPEEEQALDRAKTPLRRNGGKGIPHEEVLAEFGLTLADFPLKYDGA